jgi:hypothetical protein
MKVDYVTHIGDDLEIARSFRSDSQAEWEWMCPCGALEGSCGGNGTSCHYMWPTLPIREERLLKLLGREGWHGPFRHGVVVLRVSDDNPRRGCGELSVTLADGTEEQFMLPSWVEPSCRWTYSLPAYAALYRWIRQTNQRPEMKALAAAIADEIGQLFPASWNALTQGIYT